MGCVVMIAPEFPATGWVVNERYDEVEPVTVIDPDRAGWLSAGVVATSVKVGDDPDVVRLIEQPEYVTTPFKSLELQPLRVPKGVGFPLASPRVKLMGERSVASGLLPK